MRIKAVNSRKTSPKCGKRILSGALAAGILLELTGLWGIGFTARAAGNTLEMPEGPPVPVMSQEVAEVIDQTLFQAHYGNEFMYWLDFSGYSLANHMTLKSSEGVWTKRYIQAQGANLANLDIYGNSDYERRTWNAVFTWEDFPYDDFPEAYSWDDIRVNMGTVGIGYSSRCKVQVGHTLYEQAGEMDQEPLSIITNEWNPMPDVTCPQMVITGTGPNTSAHHSWYVMADMVSPGEVTQSEPEPWEIVITEDAQAYGGRPVIWLCEEEQMRPVNENITTKDLSKLTLEVGMVPKDNPTGEVVYVTAQAVALENGLEAATRKGGALGFQIVDDSVLDGKQYQIVSLENKTDIDEVYELYLYEPYDSYVSEGRFFVNAPVTDLAGNPVSLMADGKKNVRAQSLYLDNEPVTVDKLLLSGSNVDSSVTSLPEEWPEDLDRSKLFSGPGDQIQFRVQLSEQIAPLTQEQMEKIKLTLNLTKSEDGEQVPVTADLISVENSYANGVNGEAVSVLVFQTVTVEQEFGPQGVQIRAVSLSGADSLRDLSGNEMQTQKGTVSLEEFSPDVQNYLDTQAPTAALDSAVKVGTDEYLITMQVKDVTGDGVFAGAASGKLGLTSYLGASAISYEYSFDASPETPETYDHSGTMTASGNVIFNDVLLPQDGTYYLHLKLLDTQGKELDDTEPFVIHFYAEDQIGNGATYALSTTGQDISMDDAPPTVSISNVRVQAKQEEGGQNTAILMATIGAADLNGVDMVRYQWVEAQSEPQADAWVEAELSQNGTATVTTTVTGTASVNQKLVVQAFDTHENMGQAEQTLTADLSKTVVQYSTAGNLDVPSAHPDLVIEPPTWTGEDGQASSLYTRAILTMGSTTYVGIIDAADGITLFGSDSGTVHWYQVSISQNSYSSVEAVTAPDWSYYGPVTVRLNASAKDLTPISGKAVDDSGDTTRSDDVQLDVSHAPKNDEVFAVEFQGVQDSSGAEVAQSTQGSYRYYLLNQNMAGARFQVTIANSKYEAWGVQDLDLEASYALLVATDEEGNLIAGEDGTTPAPESVVSQAISLSNRTQQWISAPAQDQNGNVLTTGSYTLWLHVVQKGGGVQDVYLPDAVSANGTRDGYVLLDAGQIPEKFGIMEYSGTVPAAYDYTEAKLLAWESPTPESGTFQVINVGVAAPSRATATVPQEGQDIAEARNLTPILVGDSIVGYEESMNSLSNESGLLELSLQSVATQEEGASQWLGVDLGNVAGMKIWNAGATGNPEDLEYKAVNGAKGKATMYVFQGLDWYGINHDGEVVEDLSQYTVQEAGNSDLKFTLGTNTLYYQLKMDNGRVSPVYHVQINLTTQEPELELNYNFGPQVEFDSGKAYSDYVDVTVSNAFSPNGDAKVYHGYKTQVGWNYEEITDWNQPVRVQVNQNGEWGSTGARASVAGSDLNITECFCVVDGAGNSKTIYPTFHLDEYDTEYYGMAEVATKVSASAGAEGSNGYSITAYIAESDVWNNFEDSVESLSVQVDGRTAVDVKKLSQYTAEENEAGIFGFHAINVNGNNPGMQIYGEFCYDPQQPEGASLEHTITVRIRQKTSDTTRPDFEKTFTFQAPNIEPTLTVDEASTANQGCAYVESSQFVKITELLDGEGNEIALESDFYKAHRLPIYENGSYSMTYCDLYGGSYQAQIQVTGIAEDPKVTFSTREYTQEPVTVTLSSQQYTLEMSDPDPAWEVSGQGTGELAITIPKNTSFYVDIYSGEEYQFSKEIQVNNIYNTEIVPQLRWDALDVIDRENNVIYGEVTVYLTDKNGSTLIDPLTGTYPQYVFTPGGETSYTFRGYVNQYGMQGPDITAELEVELKSYPTQEEDVAPPDVGMTGYRVYQGVPTEAGAAFQQKQEDGPEYESNLPDYASQYGAENVYTDMDAFLSRMGWAESYRWNVSISDESAVRLFVKSDLYGEVPDYETGASDQIPGVKLQGRSLEITGNAEFVLYAVDESNNTSVIRMNITAVGQQVDPEYAQVVVDGGASERIYLLPPNMDGVTDLKITNDSNQDGTPDAVVDEDENSSFYGYSYLSFRENGPVNVFYSYQYRGETITGQMELEITGVDTTPPVAEEVKWSANHDLSATNQEVSTQIQFSRPLQEVYPVNSQGNQIPVPQGVTISFLENQVTVTYAKNAPALTLRGVALGREDLMGVVSLEAVDNIDTTAPEVTYQVAYSQNHRQAAINFTSNETVILAQTGAKGKTMTETVGDNGVKKYIFTDLAGNAVTVSVSITDVVEEELNLWVSSTADDSGVMDPTQYKAQVGDTVYVKVNRASSLTVSGGEKVEVPADTWTAVEIAEDLAGLYPTIRAEDAYGNATMVQLLKVALPDRTAPVMLLLRQTLTVSAGTSKEEIDARLRDNVTAFDFETPATELEFEFTYDPQVTGVQKVIYSVRDAAGNQRTVEGKLNIRPGSDPTITVDGQLVGWDDILIVEAGTKMVEVSFNGNCYKLEWKAGNKTEGQMKNGTQSLTNGYVADQEKTMSVSLEKSGYYTFMLTTQLHETYRFVIYVK